MSYGEKIKSIRESKGMTQEDLGEMIGVSKQMICQLERGTKNLTLQITAQIADALGVKMVDIIE